MNKPIWQSTMQSTDIEIKEDNLIYSGFYKVRRYQLRHKCFEGKWTPWLTREQIHHADATAVLLYDPIQDKVVLVEQFRMGLLGRDNSPWMLEIVAGLQDKNETPEQTALRESQEESGCIPSELIKIGEFYNTPGGFAEKTTVFCGICDSTGREGIYGENAEHENIRVHVLPAKEVLSWLNANKLVTSASTVIALQWLDKYMNGKV